MSKCILRVVLCCVLVVVGIVPGAAVSAQEGPAITYLRYDTDIQINQDGTFTVREIQQLRFDGEFSTAFAEIPRDYTTNIRNIQIWEGDTPYTYGSGAGTYGYELNPDNVLIDWEYSATEPGDVRTFILEYVVAGGLWVYPDGDQLEWRAVPADRSGVPVETSRVTVTLPVAVPVSDLRYAAFGPDFTASPSEGQVVFQAAGSIPQGTQFQVLVGFPHGLVDTEVQQWQLAEDRARLEYRFERMDVELTIEADGTVTVEERQSVAVEAGTLAEGRRAINLSALDDVGNVQVWEGEQEFEEGSLGCDYCFTVSRRPRDPEWVRYDSTGFTLDQTQAGEVEIHWMFPALVKGEATTFRLRYDALGALQVTDERQELNWTAVFSGRDAPVGAASVRIHLPRRVDPDEVTIDGQSPVPEPDGSILLQREGPIPPGQNWQVRVTLPPDATTAAVPQWQREQAEAVDAYRAAVEAAQQAEIRRARLQLFMGAGGLLFLLGGLVGVLLLWYVWGRDRHVALPAEYITEPPSELPPAIVAYLLDEKPSTKGALSGLFQLARLGLLTIPLSGPLTVQRSGPDKLEEGATVTTPEGETVAVPSHLAILYNALAPEVPTDDDVTLTRVGSTFQRALPEVYYRMGAEAAGYFRELPTQSRHRWLVAGQWLVLAGVAALALLWLFYRDEVGEVVVVPPIAGMVVGLALAGISRWMGQRTSAGAEEAARWMAFKRYLQNLKRYGNVESAQEILDRYFAYAVALDVEEVVLVQAEEMGASLPAWTQPLPTRRQYHDYHRRRRYERADARTTTGETTPASQPVASAPVGAPDLAQEPRPTRPTLQGLSNRLAQSLNDANTNLTSLLNTAAGERGEETPFRMVVKGAAKTTEVTAQAASSTMDIIGEILEAAASAEGSGGYSSGSSRSSSRSSFGGSSSSGRSSSSRRSGGGGRRGFG